MPVIHIKPTDTPDFSSKKCILKFSATWCGPCKVIAVPFEHLSEQNPDISFFHLDVDENISLTEKYNVTAMPTFVFLNNKKEVDRLLGANQKELNRLTQKLKNN